MQADGGFGMCELLALKLATLGSGPLKGHLSVPASTCVAP
jgi:hypothetical protein